MSFGYSVGDLLTALELANDIRRRFVKTTDEFKAIPKELSPGHAQGGQVLNVSQYQVAEDCSSRY